MEGKGEKVKGERINTTEKRLRFLINFAYFLVIALVYYWFFSRGIHYIMPFVIAFFIAMLLDKPVRWLSSKPHVSRKLVSGLALVLFYGIIVTLLSFIVNRLLNAVFNWFDNLPEIYRVYVEPAATKLLVWYDHNIAVLLPGFQEDVESNMGDILNALSGLFSGASTAAVRLAQSFVVAAPSGLFALLFGIVASVYFCLDYPGLSYFLAHQVGLERYELTADIRRYLSESFGKFIWSYLKILIVTFLELLISFVVIRQQDAALLAMIIAVFDILPVLGVGTILWPWALVSYLNGNPVKALQLMVIYLIITVVRRVIEPLIVGDSIGLSAATTIISMYLGIKVFGGIGLLVGPFTAIVVKNLNDTGKIHLYNSEYLKEDKAPEDALSKRAAWLAKKLKKKSRT